MQRGSFFHASKKWYLRYYVWELDGNGKRVQKKACKQLGPWNGEDTPPASIQRYANEILAPENAEVKPQALITFVDFVDKLYLPACQKVKRPATYQAYADAWKLLRPRVPVDLTLRDFGPKAGRDILHGVDQNRSKHTFTRLKYFLYGALEYAIGQEIIGDGTSGWGNPMAHVEQPKGNDPEEKVPYTAEEIAGMLRIVSDPVARTMILVAAMTGLRKSEIAGLCFEDIDEKRGTIKVRRSIYWGRAPKLEADGAVEVLRYHIGATKTKGSKAELPISSRVMAALLALKPSPNATGWIFRKKGPLDPANLVSYHIAPKLAKVTIRWRGWHCFRHGVATLLDRPDVTPKTAQQLMRHSNITTTLQVYTHADSKAARRAVEELDAALAEAEAKIA